MKKIFVSLVLMGIFAGISSLSAAASNDDYISMRFPQTSLAKAINSIIPLSFQNTTEKIEGNITIADISNLRILQDKISCHIKLLGKDLKLVTSMSGQVIKLKVGDAHVDFNCAAQLHFDRSQKKLFLQPVANDVDISQAMQSGDIGKAMLALVNGQKFEIPFSDFNPFTAEFHNKSISIQPRIHSIKALEGALVITLEPEITTKETAQQSSSATSKQSAPTTNQAVHTT